MIKGRCSTWTGAKTTAGYGELVVDGQVRYTHILAWEAKFGPVPDGYELDHECHNRACRNTDHMRLATHQQNCQNQEKRPNTTSRFKGVHWDKSRSRWRAQIACDGKRQFLGRFDCEEDAARTYDKHARQLFGDFCHLNFDAAAREAPTMEQERLV